MKGCYYWHYRNKKNNKGILRTTVSQQIIYLDKIDILLEPDSWNRKSE